MKIARKMSVLFATGFLVASFPILALLQGCSTTGTPPGPVSSKFLNVETNYIPIVQVVTNVQTVTVQRTNVVTTVVTNEVGVTVPVTNYAVVTVPTLVTNRALETNLVPSYGYTPNANATSITNTAGAVGNLFGVGGAVATGLSLLFGLWAKLKSGQNYNTAANMSQTIETMRAFIQSLPNGANYDNALVSWMQAHQMEAGVTGQVLTILNNNVDGDKAKYAAQQMLLALQSLQQSTTAATTTTTPPAKT